MILATIFEGSPVWYLQCTDESITTQGSSPSQEDAADEENED